MISEKPEMSNFINRCEHKNAILSFWRKVGLMERNRAADLRLSIETAANDALHVCGEAAVREIFSTFGAKGFEDLPESSLDQVFSELTRLASD